VPVAYFAACARVRNARSHRPQNGVNYLIDVEHAIIVDVEATPARTFDEVAATETMVERRSTAPNKGQIH
jgi:hypothetical protein